MSISYQYICINNLRQSTKYMYWDKKTEHFYRKQEHLWTKRHSPVVSQSFHFKGTLQVISDTSSKLCKPLDFVTTVSKINVY